MLQEFHSWTQEREDSWQKTREEGCLNYILKVTAIAFLGASVVSLVYCGITLAGRLDFLLSTALVIPVVGTLSGLIVGRTKWELSESSFKK